MPSHNLRHPTAQNSCVLDSTSTHCKKDDVFANLAGAELYVGHALHTRTYGIPIGLDRRRLVSCPNMRDENAETSFLVIGPRLTCRRRHSLRREAASRLEGESGKCHIVHRLQRSRRCISAGP